MLINYNKKSNYIAFALYVILMAFSYLDIIGNFFETTMLLTAIFLLWIVVNSNNMLSPIYLANTKKEQIKRDEIKLLETSYLSVFTGAWIFMLFTISYLLLKISVIYSAFASLGALLTLMVLIWHLRTKEKHLPKSKRIKVRVQDYMINYFGLPLFIVWQYFMYIDSGVGELSLLTLPVLGIYIIFMTSKGVLRIKALR